MSLLEIKNLKKSFGDNVVLKDISLNVEKGEVLAIIGPSGSDALQIWKPKTVGKSNLMEPSDSFSRTSICFRITQ